MKNKERLDLFNTFAEIYPDMSVKHFRNILDVFEGLQKLSHKEQDVLIDYLYESMERK